MSEAKNNEKKWNINVENEIIKRQKKMKNQTEESVERNH